MPANAQSPTLVARRWTLRVLGRIALALVTLLLGHGAVGLIGGALPVKCRLASAGVTIWVESNGVHTGLVVPKVAARIDWRPFAPSGDLADMGSIENRFLATPTWADVRPRDVLAAAVGSERTLLHFEHVPEPVAEANVRRVRMPSEPPAQPLCPKARTRPPPDRI